MSFNFLWVACFAIAMVLIVIVIDLLVQQKVHPVCRTCGATLHEENTVTQDGDGDICTTCYARLICPEYYEHYFVDR